MVDRYPIASFSKSPIKENYEEYRACFKCGERGHLLATCPYVRHKRHEVEMKQRHDYPVDNYSYPQRRFFPQPAPYYNQNNFYNKRENRPMTYDKRNRIATEKPVKKPVMNSTADNKKVAPKPNVKPAVGPVSVKSEKVTKNVSFKNEVKKPTETPKSQIRILKRSEQYWSPKGSQGASSSQENVKSEIEKDVIDQKKRSIQINLFVRKNL